MPMNWTTKKPCASCPYRKDAPLGFWDKSHFDKLSADDADPLNGAIYQCHGTRKRPEGTDVCAGWLLDQKRRNIPSIQLRLALFRSKQACDLLEAVDPGELELYGSIDEMVDANNLVYSVQARLQEEE